MVLRSIQILTWLAAVILSGVSVLFASLHGDLLFLLTPPLLVFLHAALVLSPRLTSRSHVSEAGDQVYYLGYLCTLVSLTSLLARVGFIEKAINIELTMLAASVALSTTIAGMIALSFSRAVASSVTDANAVESRKLLKEVMNENLSERLRSSGEALDTLSRRISSVASSAENVSRSLNAVQASGDGAATSLARLGHASSHSASKTEGYGKRVQALDRTLSRLAHKLPRKKELDELVRALAVAGQILEEDVVWLKEVQERVVSLRAASEGAAGPVLDGARRARELSTELVELTQVLDEFVKHKKRSIDPFKTLGVDGAPP